MIVLNGIHAHHDECMHKFQKKKISFRMGVKGNNKNRTNEGEHVRLINRSEIKQRKISYSTAK